MNTGRWATTKSKRTRPKIDKTLKELIPVYQGRVVRIGTDGSGYFVCGTLNDELLEDLNYWEQVTKERKATVIAKMEAQLADAKTNLPKLKRKDPILRDQYEKVNSEYETVAAEVITRNNERAKRRLELSAAVDRFLDKAKIINEEMIGNLSPRGRAGGRRSFRAWARKRKTKYKRRLKSYLSYLDEQDARDRERLNKVSVKKAEAEKNYLNNRRGMELAKGKIEVFPSKIRRGHKYLEEYIPMMERPVVDIYKSTLGKDETSIIVYGAEQGYFWDCEEFNAWKNTGRLYEEEDGYVLREDR